jgi:hypothetical protein
MASCGEMRLLLGPFDDGELEPHEMEEVAFHVVGCGECKAELDAYRSLGVALRDVITVPPLDRFAQEVVAHLAPRPIPLRTRLEQWWESLGRLGSVIELGSVAAATAVLTLLLAGPDVRHFVASHEAHSIGTGTATLTRPAPMLASANPAVRDVPSNNAALNVKPAMTDQNLANVVDQSKIKAASDLQEMISDLGGGHSPSIAVWNEPLTDTTVVWIPDQP